VRRAEIRHPVLDRGRRWVERYGAEGVGQRLLIPAGDEPGVPSWGWGSLLVQRLLLLRLWPRQEAERRVEARCGHEGMRTLLSSGHGAGVHSHVPLPRVAVGRPRCVGPTVGNGGRWSGQKSHHDLRRRCCSCCCGRRHDCYYDFCCATWSGCHRCCHWVGETAWKTVAWPPGMQRWCRVLSGQLEARYCPYKSPP
jgi:hypothetical protein